MLMNIKCSAVTSVEVHLEFDDNSTKDQVISKGDLIDVEYNRNGCRTRFQGKVIKISGTSNADPKSWVIIVDGSGDFESDQARFSPMNILDIEVIQKAECIQYIYTPKDITAIVGLREVKGRLQYTKDGIHWNYFTVDQRNINIKPEEGTMPEDDGYCPREGIPHDNPYKDCIKDETGGY